MLTLTSIHEHASLSLKYVIELCTVYVRQTINYNVNASNAIILILSYINLRGEGITKILFGTKFLKYTVRFETRPLF